MIAIIKPNLGMTVIATAFILQACQPSVPEYFQEVDVVATQRATAQTAAASACKSASLQWMIGQPEGVIAGVQVGGPVRVIAYNQTVSIDQNPTRTNFYLDTAGRITRVTCG